MAMTANCWSLTRTAFGYFSATVPWLLANTTSLINCCAISVSLSAQTTKAARQHGFILGIPQTTGANPDFSFSADFLKFAPEQIIMRAYLDNAATTPMA